MTVHHEVRYPTCVRRAQSDDGNRTALWGDGQLPESRFTMQAPSLPLYELASVLIVEITRSAVGTCSFSVKYEKGVCLVLLRDPPRARWASLVAPCRSPPILSWWVPSPSHVSTFLWRPLCTSCGDGCTLLPLAWPWRTVPDQATPPFVIPMPSFPHAERLLLIVMYECSHFTVHVTQVFVLVVFTNNPAYHLHIFHLPLLLTRLQLLLIFF